MCLRTVHNDDVTTIRKDYPDMDPTRQESSGFDWVFCPLTPAVFLFKGTVSRDGFGF